ncbi:peptidase T [Staphylococcus chromogenes]|uniref:peptidase T n=1 Tax=Staphylococcus chromogenes TaxID=46126 RepID=UPI000D19E570|nr:peptidase T [Staphylococcus chromogenes]PTG56665.1 peptidase T [Staphylococcus chromogenes]
MKENIIERLTRYVKINTQSNPHSETTPSTPEQWDLLHLLEDELKTMGLKTELDAHGYLFATLESNTTKTVPTIGFLAHVDTSPDFNAAHVHPQLIENYDGGTIQLGDSGRIIDPEVFPDIVKVKSHTLMTTDGTSLLGADDKAGVVEIMEALQYLKNHPEIKHGTIRIGFTPDEEIGRGPHQFNVEKFNADFAYTMDGSQLGELQFESFNAAEAKVTFEGVNVHPGSAKNKMVNASALATQFHAQLPEKEVPEHTEDYEGFYHLTEIEGNVETATLHYILRDHDHESFEKRKQTLIDIQAHMNAKYHYDPVQLVINDQYRNMAEKINPHPHIIDVPKRVYESLNIVPNTAPIRGGTDGSQLSFMGLPTPNIFTGCDHFHGPYEYASIDVMAQAIKVIIRIVQTFEKEA